MQCHNSFLANSHNRCFDAICILYEYSIIRVLVVCSATLKQNTNCVRIDIFANHVQCSHIISHYYLMQLCYFWPYKCVFCVCLYAVRMIFARKPNGMWAVNMRLANGIPFCCILWSIEQIFELRLAKYLFPYETQHCLQQKARIHCAECVLLRSTCAHYAQTHTDMFEYSQYWVNIFEGYCIVSIKPSQRWKLDPFQPLALRQNKYYSYSLIRGERLSQKLPHWWTVNEWQSSGRPCSTDIKRSRWIILE